MEEHNYKCPYCNFTCMWFDDLEKHMKKFHK